MHLSGVYVNHVQFSIQMFPNIAFKFFFLVYLSTVPTNLFYSSLSVSERVVNKPSSCFQSSF